jgi:hypothetical protein
MKPTCIPHVFMEILNLFSNLLETPPVYGFSCFATSNLKVRSIFPTRGRSSMSEMTHRMWDNFALAGRGYIVIRGRK